jgi:nanoRNase/pAp phosphatase (c-di-AMP/oligoRNAs hydrolase)
LGKLSKEPVVILLSGHPDPDAIGSALAHQRLCRRIGLEATIAHVLPIARPENRALVELLDIQMRRIRDGQALRPYTHVSLVDTTSVEATIQLPWGLHLATVVDHHGSSVESHPPFVDVRPWVGATSTIYAEYAEFGAWPLRKDVVDDVRVATALLFGIQTDTDDFALASAADFRAAAYLKPFCDTAVLDKLRRRALTAQAIDVLGRALGDLTLVRSFALAGVGNVPADQREAIPAAAEFILRHEHVETVVVYGLVADRIDGSLRTNNSQLDCSLLLQSAFGTDAAGRPFGGGRRGKGGFQIPLATLGPHDSAPVWPSVQAAIWQGLSRAIPDLRAAKPFP